MRIGVDLGGTKIESIAISATGDEIARKRIETPKGDYKGTLEAIRLVVRAVEEKISNSNDHIRPAVGIGIPGSLKRQSNVVQNSNSTWIIGKNIKKDVEDIVTFCTEKSIDVSDIKNDDSNGNGDNGSYLIAKEIRHPIIERIQTNLEYVTNDIHLGNNEKDNKNDNINGMIITGLNGVGKSVLIKMVATSIIMAQSGMYVPASIYKYFPYNEKFDRAPLAAWKTHLYLLVLRDKKGRCILILSGQLVVARR